MFKSFRSQLARLEGGWLEWIVWVLTQLLELLGMVLTWARQRWGVWLFLHQAQLCNCCGGRRRRRVDGVHPSPQRTDVLQSQWILVYHQRQVHLRFQKLWKCVGGSWLVQELHLRLSRRLANLSIYQQSLDNCGPCGGRNLHNYAGTVILVI